jgi:hypothetical protein
MLRRRAVQVQGCRSRLKAVARPVTGRKSSEGESPMFSNLRIGTRQRACFGVVLALLCVMAAWQMGRLDDGADYHSENIVPSSQIAANVR